MIAHVDDLGAPSAYNHYAVGWAHAMDTPYQWTKQVASHWGGTRNGTIVHWPNGIAAKGELRHQFAHVIDVAPTVLEAAGLPAPTLVNGVLQEPLHGVSMAYAFDDAGAAERHETQYFEMVCNRGIYHQGWTAVTRHSTPVGRGGPQPAPSTRTSGSCTTPPRTGRRRTTSPRSSPRSSAALQRLFEIEAAKYNVFPLDDRGAERLNPELAGRPRAVRGTTQRLFRRDAPAAGERRAQRHQQVVRRHGRGRGARGAARRGVIVAHGGRHRRLEPLRPRGPADVLLQPVRASSAFTAARGAPAGRDAPGADGVRLRRRGPGQGRRRHPLRRRRRGRRGAASSARTGLPLLASTRRSTSAATSASPVSEDYGARRERLHRDGQLGPARHRRRRGPGPPAHAEERFHLAMARQ